MEHWLWIILATDGVLQPERDVMAAEGGSATLNCLYNTSASNHYLYWYRLEEGSSPTFILSRFKIGDGKTVEKRFSSSLDATARSVPLTIQDLRPSDSAVYYCALQPTVTGNTRTLYKNLQYSTAKRKPSSKFLMKSTTCLQEPEKLRSGLKHTRETLFDENHQLVPCLPQFTSKPSRDGTT
uniref:Ig-like domain-containing protein n=1 Tax=Xiphophorus maculatus TaxID=8083 RepID=A0A3B5QYQ0_XIPMA